MFLKKAESTFHDLFKAMLNQLTPLFLLCFISLSPAQASERRLTHPKSICYVTVSEGEQTHLKVFRGSEKFLLYAPITTNMGLPLFSPSGRFIAIPSSKSSSVELNGTNYGFVVMNCDSGRLRGYLPGKKLSKESLRWNTDENFVFIDQTEIDLRGKAPPPYIPGPNSNQL